MGYFEYIFATLITIGFVHYMIKRDKRLKEYQRRTYMINNLRRWRK